MRKWLVTFWNGGTVEVRAKNQREAASKARRRHAGKIIGIRQA